MTYSSSNTFLSLKCLDMQHAHKIFHFTEDIIECLMKYQILKSQAVHIWKKEFSDIQQHIKKVKNYILEISNFQSNSSYIALIIILEWVSCHIEQTKKTCDHSDNKWVNCCYEKSQWRSELFHHTITESWISSNIWEAAWSKTE